MARMAHKIHLLLLIIVRTRSLGEGELVNDMRLVSLLARLTLLDKAEENEGTDKEGKTTQGSKGNTDFRTSANVVLETSAQSLSRVRDALNPGGSGDCFGHHVPSTTSDDSGRSIEDFGVSRDGGRFFISQRPRERAKGISTNSRARS